MKKSIKEMWGELLAELAEVTCFNNKRSFNDNCFIITLWIIAIAFIMILSGCCTQTTMTYKETITEDGKTTVIEVTKDKYNGFLPWSEGKQIYLKK